MSEDHAEHVKAHAMYMSAAMFRTGAPQPWWRRWLVRVGLSNPPLTPWQVRALLNQHITEHIWNDANNKSKDNEATGR